MKIRFYLLVAAIGLLFYSSTSAQNTRNKVYLKSDELFKSIASQELETVDNTKLENFGRTIERDLSDQKRPEREAAIFAAKLQTNPESFVGTRTASTNTGPQVRALQADKLFTEYVKVLITSSSESRNDPLNEFINRLQSSEGQRLLNEDLEQRLGTGAEREDNAAKLFSTIKENLSKERLDQLRIELGNAATAALPYPLCLMKGPCPN